MAKLKFQTPTGMHDILPEDQAYYQRIFETIKKFFDFYGYSRIETPVLEDIELFNRSVGEGTDIVEKEMFSLKTRGGDHLALRPEGTAPIMRAYFQNGMVSLPQPVKLWYYGPFFRYERPQAGRFRQFYQFGAEIIGDEDPFFDVQAILILYNILEDLKIKNLIVRINSIGDDECRGEYKKALSKYLKNRKNNLCADCQNRSKTNVLRVLDCKNPKCREVISQAPQTMDYLCDGCRAHLKEVLEYLDELKIPYILDPFLVRGLDYYTRTVFELEVQNSGDGRQEALSGGGRYDILGKAIAGEAVPACGMAVGIERVIQKMKDNEVDVFHKKHAHVFLAQIGPMAKKRGMAIIEEFRKANMKIAECFNKDSLKLQLAKASKMGIKNVIIIGQKETIQNTAIIRNMETGKQLEVSQEDIVKEIKKTIKED
ncbi:MAG: histidine--tRNA ligase [Minisyncoccus archaeiphilus]|jgi:histidyl-tRNA synthetase|uniref:histidine--tRNA ligase n=1 Tax=Minisyncoccus archaeiphilus TaxID=3238481 RepID=UPI0009CA0EB2|nr:MAG: Histidine--tRNA ligase [Parcubacteria group bacterium ADurb.Bin216]GMX59727.1 MAG: histidine--tRNA ligase [Candidatus Parcubacteria bacterium]